MIKWNNCHWLALLLWFACATAPGQESISADQLVALALEANPGLAAADAATRAAAHRIDIAASLDDPMLSYGLAPRTLGDGRVNQRIELGQKFPWPGTLAARESAARLEARAVQLDARALSLSVVAQARAAHAEWAFIDRAIEIQQQDIGLSETLLEATRSRYGAGIGTRQDALQAEMALEAARVRLLRLQREREALLARINALLNRPPDTVLPPAQVEQLAEPVPELASLQVRAVAHHPELARLQAEQGASAHRVELARKAFYPDLQVGVGYNGLWDEADKRPFVGVALNLPFGRDRRRAELARAQAESQQAEWQLLARRAELTARVAEAHAKVLETSAVKAAQEERLVPLAEELLDAAMADYRSGRGAFLNVIEAQQQRVAARLALQRAWADLRRSRAELERWTGGEAQG